MEERVVFLSGSLKIEGSMAQPEGTGSHPAVVLCHPHPQFGGDMENNVVVRVARILRREGIVTLRFNFRGVGSSEGSYANGEGEVADVHSALDFFVDRPFVDRDRLFVAGYSFGAWVGLQAAHERKDIKGLIAISPPLSMYDFTFLERDPRPKLVLFGDQDFVCPVRSAEGFYQALPNPKGMRVLTGADHFLWGYEEEVGREIARFIKGHANM